MGFGKEQYVAWKEIRILLSFKKSLWKHWLVKTGLESNFDSVEEAENREEMSRNVKAEGHQKSLEEKENVRHSNESRRTNNNAVEGKDFSLN